MGDARSRASPRRAGGTSVPWPATRPRPTSSTSPCGTRARSRARPLRRCPRGAPRAPAAGPLECPVREGRVLARAAVTRVRERGAAHGQLAEAILGLALAVEALAGYLERPDYPSDVRLFALGAAQEATASLGTSNDLETSALVSQV